MENIKAYYIKDYEELRMPFKTKADYLARKYYWRIVKQPSTKKWDKSQHIMHLQYGKHSGKSYEEIVQEDMEYAIWLVTEAKRMSENDRRYMGWLIWMYQ